MWGGGGAVRNYSMVIMISELPQTSWSIVDIAIVFSFNAKVKMSEVLYN